MLVLFASLVRAQSEKLIYGENSIEISEKGDIKSLESSITEHDFTLITFVDGGCGQCFMALQKLDTLKNGLKYFHQFSVLIYVKNDRELFDYYYDSKYNFSFPIIDDKDNLLIQNNPNLFKNDINTILISSSSEVLLKGNVFTKRFISDIKEFVDSSPKFIDSNLKHPWDF